MYRSKLAIERIIQHARNASVPRARLPIQGDLTHGVPSLRTTLLRSAQEFMNVNGAASVPSLLRTSTSFLLTHPFWPEQRSSALVSQRRAYSSSDFRRSEFVPLKFQQTLKFPLWLWVPPLFCLLLLWGEKKNDVEAAEEESIPPIPMDFYEAMAAKTYSGVTTHRELAMMSALAYRSVAEHHKASQESEPSKDKRLRWWQELSKAGWEVFDAQEAKDSELGFQAIAYIHQGRQQVVIAFRGTEPKDLATLWTDWEGVVQSKLEKHTEQAYEFVQRVSKKLILRSFHHHHKEALSPTCYQLQFTGHSLGAWLASFACANSAVEESFCPAVVFDCPGAKGIIKETDIGEIYPSLSSTQIYPLTTYLAHPHFINTTHQQVSVDCFQLTTEASPRTHSRTELRREVAYTLGQHSIESIVEVFDETTGMPSLDKMKKAIQWPCGGAESAKALVAVLPESLSDLGYEILKSYFEGLTPGRAFKVITSATNISASMRNLLSLNIVNKAYQAIDKVFGVIHSYDYATLMAEGEFSQTGNDTFRKRLIGHYHTVPFNKKQLSIELMPREVFNELQNIVNQRNSFKLHFPRKYDYLNHIHLIYPQNKGSVFEISSDIPMTAVQLYREIMGGSKEEFECVLAAALNSRLEQKGIGTSFSKYLYGLPLLPSYPIFREEFLKKLNDTLSEEVPGVFRIRGLYGPPGIGKTELARSYAHVALEQGRYDAVIWLEGEDLNGSYLKFARHLLENPTLSESDLPLERIFELVQRKLTERYGRILVVFNNVESDATKLQPYLNPWPYRERVDILLTTRSQELAEYYEAPIKVDSFTMEEARRYLQKALSLTEVQLVDAEALAQAVECHPLSLFYLAGYIKSEAITLKACLDRYEKERVNFLKIVALSHTTPEQGVAAFMLFRQIQEQDPLAAQLLQVCAFLSADSISLDLLQDCFSTQSKEEVTAAWKCLRHVSFVNSQPGYLSMHRLLQEIVRCDLVEDITRYQNLVSKLLTFFEEKVKNFKTVLPLTPGGEKEREVIREQFAHVKAFCLHMTQTKVELTPEIQTILVNLLIRSGNYFYQQGNYREAKYYFKQELFIQKQSLGEEHLAVAASLNNLGGAYHGQGDYSKAIRYLEQALCIRKQSLGEEHSDVADSLNNLGVTHAHQGDYPKTIRYLEQALSIWKKNLGEEHPHVATSLNNLGAAYTNQGDYPKAIRYLEQALSIRKKSLGERHPELAVSLNNLGAVYDSQGDYPKAIHYHEQALSIRKQSLREEHPDVASSLNNLGATYTSQGDYPKAIYYHEQALRIRRQSLGEEHPDVANSLNNLGAAYARQGDYLKAIRYYEQALFIRKKSLGEEHPDVANSLNNLGAAYDSQEDYPKAIRHYEQALCIMKQSLGEEYPDVASLLNNLGEAYARQGDYLKAIRYHEQVLSIQKQGLGNEHPKIAFSHRKIGVLHYNQNNFSEAKEHLEQALQIYKVMPQPNQQDIETVEKLLSDCERQLKPSRGFGCSVM